MLRSLSVAVLVLALLPAPAAGQSPSSAIKKSPEALLAQSVRLASREVPVGVTQVSDWQRDYDDAVARRAAGRKKILIGAVVSGAGLAMTIIGPMMASDNLEGASGLMMMGLMADLAGTGIIVWGWVQNSDAKADIRALESRRPPTRNNGATIAINENQALRFSVGKETSIQYRVSW